MMTDAELAAAWAQMIEALTAAGHGDAADRARLIRAWQSDNRFREALADAVWAIVDDSEREAAKIKLQSIRLQRREGRSGIDDLDPHTVNSWHAANQLLRTWSATAPVPAAGYAKVSTLLTWADGYSMALRYDLTADDVLCDLGAWLRAFEAGQDVVSTEHAEWLERYSTTDD